MSVVSLTSWSLHRSLGPLHMIDWDAAQNQHVRTETPQPSHLTLLQLPGRAAERGIAALDICHFHLPETTPDYLARLHDAFSASGVLFNTLLLDYGDISSADDIRRAADLKLSETWIDIAQAAGAKRIRIVAGDSKPTDAEALDRTAAGLRHLIDYAHPRAVRVITENFRALTSTAENCLALYGQFHGDLGMIADFGNFRSPEKYSELEQILPIADAVHAKAHYDDAGTPDEPELRKCLELLQPASFDGPVTIVYDGPGDEWLGISRVQTIVREYL